MSRLKYLVHRYRRSLLAFAIWIGSTALVAISARYLRWVLWPPLAAIWSLFTAGIVLWAAIGLIDRVRGKTRAENKAAHGGPKVDGGRVFRSAVALWVILTGFYCFAAFIDDGTTFLIALGSEPLIAFWIGVVAWSSVRLVMRLRSQAVRPALRAALVPALAIGAVLYGRDIGDVVRFEIERPSYVAAIAAVRAGSSDDSHVESDIGPPLVAYFPWGGFLSVSYGVVFDEADQMAKPAAVRQEAWKARRIPFELTCEGAVLPVGGHFYIGRFSC